MKPTFQPVRAQQRETHASAPTVRLPVIEPNYQSIGLDGYRGPRTNSVPPSFRNISRDYFQTEARNHFTSEAVCFTAIVITAALPVFNSIHAVSELVRAISVS